MVSTLFTDAELVDQFGMTSRKNVLCIDGVVVSITEPEEKITQAVDQVFAVENCALLPGLHDHHVHLLAMAAALVSCDVSTLQSPQEFDRIISLRSGTSPLRVTGYDEFRHGELDRQRLDKISGNAIVRVQHRSGLAWILSSSALEVFGQNELDGIERDEKDEATGRLLRLDNEIAKRYGQEDIDLSDVLGRLHAVGITGVTDATYRLGERVNVLRTHYAKQLLPGRLVLLGLDSDIDISEFAVHGPAKILIDEVKEIDLSSLAAEISYWHNQKRAVAIHAVSRVETVAAVTALQMAGVIAGDRIEHGSILSTDTDEFLSAHQIAIVVQPALVYERGDFYFSSIEEDDFRFAHRAASLQKAGVVVAAGSDAPVTDCDPWQAIATAQSRRTRDGAEFRIEERVGGFSALQWYLADPLQLNGPIRTVAVGAPADFCVLKVPLAEMLTQPSAQKVRTTFVAGNEFSATNSHRAGRTE